MSKDYTTSTYKQLIKSLQKQDFSFLTFKSFSATTPSKTICLRHDVDLLPNNSLNFARIQHDLGIQGTYFFRAVPESCNENVIKEISKMGHEVGYHYEDLVLVNEPKMFRTISRRSRKKERPKSWMEYFETGIESFKRNLEALRKIVPVETICMHGSPMSKFDSKELWKHYNYNDFNIVAEPYFDVDFSKVLYLTDTGRRWNGGKFSVRDKFDEGSGIKYQVPGNTDRFTEWEVKPPINSSMNMSQEAIFFQNQYNYRSTLDIIQAAEEGKLPDKIMMTFHPQRWTNNSGQWIKEFVWQNTKNVVKYFLIKMRR